MRRGKVIISSLLVIQSISCGFISIVLSFEFRCFQLKTIRRFHHYHHNHSPTFFKTTKHDVVTNRPCYRYHFHHQQYQIKANSNHNDADTSVSETTTAVPKSIKVTIPIFPLRKKVRLPTDKLQLNLYEPRYIELAEYVLQQQQSSKKIFGAVYSADKPQFVCNNGSGSIVPLLQPGDIGVLFIVLNSYDGRQQQSITTSSRNNALSPRRRSSIRLIGQGGARFRILKILSDGIISNSNAGRSTNCSNDKRSFILAETEIFFDEQSITKDQVQSTKQNLQNKLLQQQEKKIKMKFEMNFINRFLFFRKSKQDNDDDDSIERNNYNNNNYSNNIDDINIASIIRRDNNDRITTREQVKYIARLTNKVLSELPDEPSTNRTNLIECELLTFALAATVIDDEDYFQRKELLQIINQQERFALIKL